MAPAPIYQEPQEPRCNRCFPNDPYFKQLLLAAESYGGVVVGDGVKADYARLLHDVSSFQSTIRGRLPENILDSNGMVKCQGVYICILAPVSYEFIVAMLAVLAVGAAVVPLSTGLMAEEVLYLYKMCDAACMLVGPEQKDVASEIRNYALQVTSSRIQQIPIEVTSDGPTPNSQYSLMEDFSFPSNWPGLVLFTSGTTGPPKGVIHGRKFFYGILESKAPHPGNTALCHRPVFWLAGFRSIARLIVEGVRLETLREGSKPDFIWERLRQGNITILECQPIVWHSMMRYYKDQLGLLPSEELQVYTEAAQRLRVVVCAGGMPPPSVRLFWYHLRNGRALSMSYTTTELGVSTLGTSPDMEISPEEPCVGKPVSHPDIEVKLSEGQRGEILVKSPYIFLKYIGQKASLDPNIFDDDGFYKTGDLAHKGENGYIYIEGRANLDFIRFYGFKVSTFEVEARLLELPYISEGYIIGVPDANTAGRVAALVRLKPNSIVSAGCQNLLPLQTLREDLHRELFLYQLPSLLRVLEDGEEFPMLENSKFAVKKAVEKYFSSQDFSLNGSPGKVQAWDVSRLRESKGGKAWDFAGLN
ncbi:hypothetical protein FQN54_004441 [Arachnomyces sp. PD_36]|nr:hypothetical protein FQN54_004441 [Arachnomyces sp. PD_36]